MVLQDSDTKKQIDRNFVEGVILEKPTGITGSQAPYFGDSVLS